MVTQTPAMANNDAVDEALQVTASQAFRKSPEASLQTISHGRFTLMKDLLAGGVALLSF
jgi:hypothetical protein